MYDEQESHEPEIASELIPLEQQLRGIWPLAPRIDRDRLMFAAGAASTDEYGQHGRAMYDQAGHPIYIAGQSWTGRIWPAATFTMTAATLLLATMLVWQHRPQPIVQQTSRMQPVIEANDHSQDSKTVDPARLTARYAWPSVPSNDTGYLGVRYVALTRGINAVPLNVPSADGHRDTQIDNERSNPATARGLLDELLPAHGRSIQSRS
jgi:hypothetical protein